MGRVGWLRGTKTVERSILKTLNKKVLPALTCTISPPRRRPLQNDHSINKYDDWFPIGRVVGTVAARSAELVCERNYGIALIGGIKAIKFTFSGRSYVVASWSETTIERQSLKAHVNII